MLAFFVAKVGICKRKKETREVKKGADKAKPRSDLQVSPLKTLNKNPLFKPRSKDV